MMRITGTDIAVYDCGEAGVQFTAVSDSGMRWFEQLAIECPLLVMDEVNYALMVEKGAAVSMLEGVLDAGLHIG